MMRPIKFRGKSLKAGEWLYGDLCRPIMQEEMTIAIWHDLGIVPVASSTVGQFTGLRDRNGKEIYEGDILRIRVYPTLETIERNERNADIMGFNMPSWMNGGDIIARVSFFDTAFHLIILSSYLPDFTGKQEPIVNYLFEERHPDFNSPYKHEITVIGNIHDCPQ